MSDDATPRLALPLLAPGQAQKEMTHNEALAALDIAVQASVVAAGIDTPPPAPTPGQCWIVGMTPTGVWSGHAAALAAWTAGGWRFLAPREGLSAWVEAQSATARFAGGTWSVGDVVGQRLVLEGVAMLGRPAASIAAPAGGGTVDTQARTAIESVLAVLRHHKLTGNP